MSLVLIQESAREVRRLSIAGSTLAVGDFRLKKLSTPLEQAGAKVPVFAQVAKAIGDLVNGKETDSAANLLSLSTLLNAILYTQGQSAAEGDYQELETFTGKSTATRTTARVLKPLIEALTKTGSGRYQVIKSAYERGAFDDLRLIEPSIRALDDVYPELADLVTENILPSYGPGITPLLRRHLDLKGKKSDARRLQVLHRLDPAGTIDLCKTALEEGSAEVRCAAVACLGRHEECLPLVLEQTNSKNKAVRAAALEAVAEHDRPEIVKLFMDLLQSKALDFLAGPFRAIRSRQVVGSFLTEGQRVFDLLLKGDEEHLPRFSEILACLDERKDAEVEAFLLSSFAQCEKINKLKAPKNSAFAGADVALRMASLLYGFGSPKTLEAVLAKREVLPSAAFDTILRSALRVWPANKVYDEFAPLLAQKGSGGKEKSRVIQVAIWSGLHADDSDFYAGEDLEPDTSDAQTLKKVQWDPRWLDAAIKADQPVIAACLARPGHKAAMSYLLGLLDSKKQAHTSLIIEALARCQCANLSDVFLEQLAKRTRGAQHFDWELHQLLESARHLPPSDLPKLDAFATKLDEKFVDKYLTALEPLRQRAQAPPPA